MADQVTIVRYEPCPECSDGSCRKCGPASGEHAGPGIRLIARRIRFVRCPVLRNLRRKADHIDCTACGPAMHPMCTVGVTIETVDERATKRWVPSVHLSVGGKALCGASVPDERLVEKFDASMKNACERCKAT